MITGIAGARPSAMSLIGCLIETGARRRWARVTRVSTLKVPGTAATTSAMLLPRRQAATSKAVSQPSAAATRRPEPVSASASV